MIYEVIVIGGGPSGLMTCNILEKHKIKYLLIEKNSKLGKKLLITGGQRCNVTNNLSIERFISSLTFKHSRFLYPALTEFGPLDIIKYFQDRNLKLVLEDNLKYFPETHKSSSVLEALTRDINPANIKFSTHVKEVVKDNDVYKVIADQQTYMAQRVVVAVGSNSYPTTGSSGDGLVFAKNFNIETIEFTPAETYVFSKQVKTTLADLQGVSLRNTTVKIVGTKISSQGGLIFTHFGLSGPAIMHISENIYKALETQKTSVSFALTEKSQEQVEILLNQSLKEKSSIIKVLEQLTTKRLANKILELANVSNKNTNEISKKDINRIIDLLINFTVEIDAVEDKEKAYVNMGGISTKALDPKTMETKIHKGLYFIGETVDVHGPIGGYNITMALSMGHLCANHIVQSLK
jgi:predicted Rossmann fold flavoprotein